MKMFLLSDDRDALTGFRLAGVEGKAIRDEAELEKAASSLRERNDVGILLVTNGLFERFSKTISALEKENAFIVTRIPDSSDPSSMGGSITDYVRNAVGIKV